MKAAILIAGIAVVAIIMVEVLGSTLGPPEFEKQDLGVTGPLAMDATSRANQDVRVWREPRSTHSRKDREEMLVGVLSEGQVFTVTNHFRRDSTLWVEVVGREDASLRGWVASPVEDPFRATKLK